MNLDDLAYLFASPAAYRDFVHQLEVALSQSDLSLYTNGKPIGGITRPVEE